MQGNASDLLLIPYLFNHSVLTGKFTCRNCRVVYKQWTKIDSEERGERCNYRKVMGFKQQGGCIWENQVLFLAQKLMKYIDWFSRGTLITPPQRKKIGCVASNVWIVNLRVRRWSWPILSPVWALAKDDWGPCLVVIQKHDIQTAS
jgi:hypothetical protein